jgi:hypothetical protein
MRLGFTMLVAAAALAAVSVPSAARGRVEARPSGSTRFTTSRLTFTSLISVVCDVTLSFGINRLIAKTRGAAAGSFQRSTVSTCSSPEEKLR